MSRHRNIRNLDYYDDYDEDSDYEEEEDDYALLDRGLNEVYHTLGEDTHFSEDQIVYALRNTKYSSEAAVSFLLEEPSPDDLVSSKQKQALKRGAAPIQENINVVALNAQKGNDKSQKIVKAPQQIKTAAGSSAKPATKPAASSKPAAAASKTSTKSSSSSSSTTTTNKLSDDIESMNLSGSLSSSSDSITITSNADDEFFVKNIPKGIKQHNVPRRKELEEKARSNASTGAKEGLTLVVIGHVDAGKSTTMGHLLYDLGYVDPKVMKKYEHESQRIGKSSFSYAWVLDEHQEERNRGVTIDVGVNHFETEHRKITLLDAPGHRDFVPNMISGTSQADVAILVVDSIQGEFEAGFNSDGQTKEHALLARSLGVSQLIVAINKMDATGWNRQRFDEIVSILTPFLKQIGFNPASVWYVPISGLSGENLVKATDPKLLSWYQGPTLATRIDSFAPTERLTSKPFRLAVSDVFKGPQLGIAVAGKIEAGLLGVGDKLLIEPVNEICTVRAIKREGEGVDFAKAGENVDIGLSDVDFSHINVGNILCDPEKPVPIVRSFSAQIITFNSLPIPITAGHQVVMHSQAIAEVGTIAKLVAIVDRATGEIKKKKPRALGENVAAHVEVVLNRPVCLELFSDYKQLGRFMLRDQGRTIAAGIIEKFNDRI